MFHLFSKTAAVLLSLASCLALAAPSDSGAKTQAAQSSLGAATTRIDLNTSLPPHEAGARWGAVLPTFAPPAPGEKLFDDPAPPERGWKALAHLLQSARPSVDTSLPLTPSQVTDRISALMDQGDYAQALDIIERREAQRSAEKALADDVQLLFLRGRALAGLGRHEQAIAHYLRMTTLFPELPEPWNNLAVEYIRQGKLQMAHDALQMAQAADPHYAAAKANMGWLQLMLAKQSFKNAERAGEAARQAEALQSHP